MTNRLASGNDLSSHTWATLMEDLKVHGLFDEYLSTLISVTGHAGEERRRWNGGRGTKAVIERFAEDSRAHFALLVHELREMRFYLTADDVLSRPQHYLTAWAIAERLEGRP